MTNLKASDGETGENLVDMNITVGDMGGPETGTNIPMSEVMGDDSASSDNQDGDDYAMAMDHYEEDHDEEYHDEDHDEKDNHDRDDHDKDDHAKPDYEKPEYEKPHHEMNDHHGPHHEKDDYEKPDHGMHDKPMNHTDDDWWYPEDEYPYASSTSTIALSIPTFILAIFNK